nr:MAG TPA: hypothetical protein [Caudoviricetes sp.]DAW54364.1 MAG TPA: hypothetical protein [Caudoviricetes sp.]
MNLLQLISSDFGHCFFYFEQTKKPPSMLAVLV